MNVIFSITMKNDDKELIRKVDINPDIKITELYDWALKQGLIPYKKNAIWSILCDRTCKKGVTMNLLVYSESKNKYVLYLEENNQSIGDFCQQEEVDSFLFDCYLSPEQYAKQLFWDYACNTTNIFRDGGYEKYMLCDVTPEMEEEWKKEYNDRIAEFRKSFISKAEPVLTQCGFQYIEKYDAFIRNNSNEEVISFHITRKHGFYFQIHLFLELFNESIGSLRESIKELISLPDRPRYSKVMEAEEKRRNSCIASVQDLRDLDMGHELHIWFESFKDITDISDFDIQLAKSVELGLSWFQSCEDFNYVIQYNLDIGTDRSVETVLLLLYYQNDLEKLDLAYEKVITKRKQNKESVYYIEEFYHALKQYIPMLENSLFYKKLNTILIERLPIICKSLNSSMAQQLEESDIFLKFKYASFKNQLYLYGWNVGMLFKENLYDDNGDIFSFLFGSIYVDNSPWLEHITLSYGVYNGTHDCPDEKVRIKKSLLNDDSIIDINLKKIELFLDNVEKTLQHEVCIFDDYYKANGDVIYYLQKD